jgi:hypothetical protein
MFQGAHARAQARRMRSEQGGVQGPGRGTRDYIKRIRRIAGQNLGDTAQYTDLIGCARTAAG